MGNDERAWWKITSKLEKSSLLGAVNCLAGLAIFFFGLSALSLPMHHLSYMVNKQSDGLSRI